MRKRPILLLVLIAMLGGSGLACACSLMSLDEPIHAHHVSHGEATVHADDRADDRAECITKCAHSANASQDKAGTLADFKFEKPQLPALHHGYAVRDNVFVQLSDWPPPDRKSLPPSSTPVSRRDTMRD
jgi:hypothetical protein